MIPQLYFCNILHYFLTFYTASNNQSHLIPHMKELPRLQFIKWFFQQIIFQNTLEKESLRECKPSKCFILNYFHYPFIF